MEISKYKSLVQSHTDSLAMVLDEFLLQFLLGNCSVPLP